MFVRVNELRFDAPMRILCDCPEVLSQWREFSTSPARASTPAGDAAVVWRVLADDASAWELVAGGAGLPEGLGVFIGRSEVSQFDQLLELARQNPELPPTVASIALTGENFHGQGQRPWCAESGNLHLTVFRRVNLPTAGTLEAISILPTLAVMDAFDIAADPGERTGIRWLNDVFVRGRKLAGAIAASETEADRVLALLFGVGVNVEAVPAVPGDVFVPEATSLRTAYPDTGWLLGPATFALIRALDTRVNQLCSGGKEGLLNDYRAASACLGRKVKVWPKRTEDPAITPALACGRVDSISPALEVCLDGVADPIAEGRLAFEEDCEALGL